MAHGNSNILINKLSFFLPNGTLLFDKLEFNLSTQKTGLVGKNGVGKSTLLKLIIQELAPDTGTIVTQGTLAYVPQTLTPPPKATLLDFWAAESPIQPSLQAFGLATLPLNYCVENLSEGELARLSLAKAFSSEADFLLLDEPTNHLDIQSRHQLYEKIHTWSGGLLAVSHDRNLLNFMDQILELSRLSYHFYGGNFEAYHAQKTIETQAAHQHLKDAKKSIKTVKRKIQVTQEQYAKKQNQGKKRYQSGGLPNLILGTRKNSSEQSLNALSIQHQRLLNASEEKLALAKERIELTEQIYTKLPKIKVPPGKILCYLKNVSFTYPNAGEPIIHNFSYTLQGPCRISFIGNNGSGKTTLVKLILGKLTPQAGKIYLGTQRVRYLDQALNQLIPEKTLLDNFLELNPNSEIKEAYQALAAFLFKNNSVFKQVKELSSGEKLKLMFACVLMGDIPPELLILDEPTNHLDLESIHTIESALNAYQGAFIVISHDLTFLKNIRIDQELRSPYCIL